MAVHHVPPGFQSVVPFLVVNGAARCIDMLVSAFGAVEKSRSPGQDGQVLHAEVQVGGDTMLMICDATPQWPPIGAMLHVYVQDCDAAYAKALSNGAEAVSAPADQFYGDRNGTVKAFGITWSISTHIEDVAPDELERRMAAYAQKSAATV